MAAIDRLNTTATAAKEVAYDDFELLVKQYGLHDEVVIGDPVDCFSDDIEEALLELLSDFCGCRFFSQ